MGLLDNLDPSTETGQRFLGLLAAAGPQTDPTKTSYAARLKMAEDGVQEWKQNKLMGEYRQVQMDAAKRQMAQQEAQAKQAAEQQSALGKLFNLTGGGGGFSPAAEGVFDGSFKYTQPTPQKLQLNQQAVIDYIRAGGDAKKAQEYADLQNIGMPEVARTIDGQDAQGRPVTYQKDKYGRDVVSPVMQWKAPVHGVEGGDFVARDGITMQPILKAPVSMTFGDKNASARLALDQQKFAFDRAGGADANKPQLVDGQWVYKPTAENPQGKTVPVAGFQKQLGEGAKKTLSGIEALNGAVSEYLKELDGWSGADVANPNKRASMGTKYNNMMLQAKEAYNLGVLNGPDYAILQSVVTDPMSISGAFTSKNALGKQATELSRMMSQYTAPSVRDSGAKAETTQAKVVSAPAAAINHLKNNPSLRSAFDAKYGQGAAAAVLGE